MSSFLYMLVECGRSPALRDVNSLVGVSDTAMRDHVGEEAR